MSWKTNRTTSPRYIKPIRPRPHKRTNSTPRPKRIPSNSRHTFQIRTIRSHIRAMGYPRSSPQQRPLQNHKTRKPFRIPSKITNSRTNRKLGPLERSRHALRTLGLPHQSPLETSIKRKTIQNVHLNITKRKAMGHHRQSYCKITR